MAKKVSSLLRKSDVFFRYGGEEFVLLLPNLNSSEAYELAEKIRITVSKSNSPIGKPITISFGIADYPQSTKSLDDLFRYADKALYKSKNDGRNRTTIWSLGMQRVRRKRVSDY